MKYLLMDSNVWLSIYSFGYNQLESFKELIKIVGKDVCLKVPEQIIDEINRNRDNKLEDMRKNLIFPKLFAFPVIAKSYPELNDIKNRFKDLENDFNLIRKKIDNDIYNNNLEADQILKELLDKSEIQPCEKYLDIAYKRYIRGNPPGKNNSYGDAIIWECILDTISEGEDLYLIADDKDYRSSLGKNRVKEFLLDEWKNKKNSNLHYYSSIPEFLKEFGIIVKGEKQELINNLIQSSSYYETHQIISKLQQYSNWDKLQIENLCSALISNKQVGDIYKDGDLTYFYGTLLCDLSYDDYPPESNTAQAIVWYQYDYYDDDYEKEKYLDSLANEDYNE